MKGRPARPDELLLVGFMSEASGYPEFRTAQVVSAFGVRNGALRGRRDITIYVSDLAWRQLEIVGTEELRVCAAHHGATIKGVREFLLEERPKPSRFERIAGAIFSPIIKLIDRGFI